MSYEGLYNRRLSPVLFSNSMTLFYRQWFSLFMLNVLLYVRASVFWNSLNKINELERNIPLPPDNHPSCLASNTHIYLPVFMHISIII